MQYNVQYNQKALIEFNKQNPGNEIDIYDAILINSIDTIIKNWNNLQAMRLGKNVYYWIAYDKLLNELPSLNISTKNGLAKRIKNKLIDNDLLKRFIVKDDNSKTFFRITDKGRLLLVRYKGATTGIDTDKRTTLPRTIGTKGTDDRQTNNNTNYNNTEDKRELSHIDFLKIKYPKDYEKLKREPVRNWNNLLRKFNNKEFKKSKPQIKDLENYILSWLENENDSKKNNNSIIENKPPYLIKIT